MKGIAIRKIVVLIIAILAMAIAFFISSLILKEVKICDPENPDILRCPIFFNPFYIEPNYCNHVFGSGDGDISYVTSPLSSGIFFNICCFDIIDSFCVMKRDCLGCVPFHEFKIKGSDLVQLGDKSFFLHWEANDITQSSIRIKKHAYLFESVGDIASALECCADDNCNSDDIDGYRVKKGILYINNVQGENTKQVVEEVTRLYCGISYKKCLMCSKDFEKRDNTAWYICSIFDYPKILKNGLESGIISVRPNNKITIDGEEWLCNKNFEWEKIK